METTDWFNKAIWKLALRKTIFYYARYHFEKYGQMYESLNNNQDLFNPLSTNPSKWSNTLKQFIG